METKKGLLLSSLESIDEILGPSRGSIDRAKCAGRDTIDHCHTYQSDQRRKLLSLPSLNLDGGFTRTSLTYMKGKYFSAENEGNEPCGKSLAALLAQLDYRITRFLCVWRLGAC